MKILKQQHTITLNLTDTDMQFLNWLIEYYEGKASVNKVYYIALMALVAELQVCGITMEQRDKLSDILKK